MHRVFDGFAGEAIEQVSRSLNLSHSLLRCGWVIGRCGKAIGLHDYDEATLGRSYSNIAAVYYPEHLKLTDPPPTVIIPTQKDENGYENCRPEVLIHELGHVLHFHLGFPDLGFTPVGWYARTNRWEEFAESFTSWLVPHYEGFDFDCNGWVTNAKPCEKAVSLFESLDILRA